MADGLYRILQNGRKSESHLAIRPNGCVELMCADDYYSGELSRKDSIAIASEVVLCLCGHAVATHLNDERACNAVSCCCHGFSLDVESAKLPLEP
jgi:hypothetical protein